MNADTERKVKEILERGMYHTSETLGDGGWYAINTSGIVWKKYVLRGEDDYGNFREVESIMAKDDDTAVFEFSKLYHLDMFEYWEVHEKIVEYRLIAIKVAIKDN